MPIFKNGYNSACCTITEQPEAVVSADQFKNEVLNAIFFDCEHPVYVKGAARSYTLVNNAAAELLGRAVEDIVGKTDEDFRPADEAQKIKEIDEHVFVTGESQTIEQTFSVNGETHVMRVKKKLYRDSGGNRHVITVVHDISKHRQIDEILKNLATRFASVQGREFFNQICMHVSEVLDAEYAFVGRLIPEELRIKVIGGVAMGKPLEAMEYDLAHTPCADVVGKEVCVYPSGVQKLFPKDILLIEMQAEGYTGIPLYGRSGDAIGIFVVMSTRPVTNSQLAVSMMSSYSERVTAEIERMEAENALRMSEERFSKAFRFSPDAISISVLETMNFVEVNEGFTAMTGFTNEEAVGVPAEELGVWSRPADRALARKALVEDRAFRDLQTVLTAKTGEARKVSMSAEVIDIGGKPHVISIARDVTEKEMIREVLEARDRDIRRAYADVFSAVTNEKLIILTPEEMEAALGQPCSKTFTTVSFAQLAESRAFIRDELARFNLSDELIASLVLASGEAVTNGVKHAGTCEVQVCSLDGAIQLIISDKGPGINFKDLPKATLLPGFSTKKSLGMGFALILDACDRVLLATGAQGTTVLLESGGKKRDITLDDILARGLLNDD